MFSIRQTTATNSELQRQQMVEDVVLFGKEPTTFIGKKAAAIVQSKSINPIIQAKVAIALDNLLEIASDEKELEKPDIKCRIREHLANVNIQTGQIIHLPRKLPILSTQPVMPPDYTAPLEITYATMVNIAEFEYQVFRGKVRYRYMRNTSFATYMYQNILYMLDVNDAKLLEGMDVWQAHYAVLLKHTDFNEYVAKKSFYEDQVTYMGISYDTTFVPNYDVNNLQPQDPIPCSVTNQSQINYYYNFDVMNTVSVPDDKLGIFLTFPFKNGHYIKPTGKIRYLGINPPSALRKSSRLLIQNICSMNDLESAMDSVARSIRLDEIIYRAVYAPTLREQAVALMIIRRIVGNYARIGKYLVQMPNEMTLLSWTKLECKNSPVILPPQYPSKTTSLYVSMIQDIAMSCFSKMGAAVICSNYGLPEINYSTVYNLLQTDAEKYIFYTLVLQRYPLPMYYKIRKILKPTFGKNTVDMARYPRFINLSYTNNTLSDRLNLITTPLVDNKSINDDGNICTPYNCSEMYEFNDPQLKSLVLYGDIELNRDQLASFIALSI